MIDIFLNYTLIQQLIISILLLSLLTQIIFYCVIYLRPVFWKQKDPNTAQHPLSVIICARNEAQNLQKNLAKVCEQSYPNFEVIVVNDCSQDESESVLAALELQYKNLRHTTIEQDKKFYHGKKLAVSIGLKSAKHEHIVFTDADCHPASNEWLQEINKAYTNNKEIVIGFGAYEKQRGLLNRIIRFETLFIGMQYLGMALAKKTYMGIGRNMSYKKSLFYNGKGFKSHYHILSGDDDLFVNEHASKQNVAVVASKNSITLSEPATSFKVWTKQKRRHFTTSKYYKSIHKFILGIENFSRLAFYASFISSFFFIPLAWYFLVIPYAFRLCLQMTVIKLNMAKLNEKGYWFLSPILDIILPILYISFIFANKLTRKSTKWT